MIKYYSKIEPDKLLHIIWRKKDFIQQRKDIIDKKHFIQCAALKLNNGKTFRPHKHIIKEECTENKIAQESWVVICGSVKCIFYDLDNTIIATPILMSGDASFTLYGGHNYEVLEDNTIVYEYKTGPYITVKKDKVFI